MHIQRLPVAMALAAVLLIGCEGMDPVAPTSNEEGSAVDPTAAPVTTRGGIHSFGLLDGYRLLPAPPLPPAVESQPINTPTTLALHDGAISIVQELPKIDGGFTTPFGVRYTGGMEIVVAEVRGGSNLRVRPASGDTIDGVGVAVPIAAHGSRTLVSDGVSNWITIAVVP